MAELVNLDEASTSRQLRQVCALPAVVRALITHACSPRASAHPFHVGRLLVDSFDGGPSRCVVVKYGPNFSVVAVVVRLEHVGESCARPARASRVWCWRPRSGRRSCAGWKLELLLSLAYLASGTQWTGQSRF